MKLADTTRKFIPPEGQLGHSAGAAAQRRLLQLGDKIFKLVE